MWLLDRGECVGSTCMYCLYVSVLHLSFCFDVGLDGIFVRHKFTQLPFHLDGCSVSAGPTTEAARRTLGAVINQQKFPPPSAV